MIGDERTENESVEQPDTEVPPKDTLEDLDVATDYGAEVKGGIVTRKAGGGQQDYT